MSAWGVQRSIVLESFSHGVEGSGSVIEGREKGASIICSLHSNAVSVERWSIIKQAVSFLESDHAFAKGVNLSPYRADVIIGHLEVNRRGSGREGAEGEGVRKSHRFGFSLWL